MYAAENGNVEMLRVLLESGADVQPGNFIQRTALHIAATNGRLEVCRLLLNWGANVDPLDWTKETPLHDAARHGHLSILKLLVEMGSDVTIKNGRGQTAGELARSEGRGYVADWLDSVRTL
jgi:ankyrin repeat protein